MCVCSSSIVACCLLASLVLFCFHRGMLLCVGECLECCLYSALFSLTHASVLDRLAIVVFSVLHHY